MAANDKVAPGIASRAASTNFQSVHPQKFADSFVPPVSQINKVGIPTKTLPGRIRIDVNQRNNINPDPYPWEKKSNNGVRSKQKKGRHRQSLRKAQFRYWDQRNPGSATDGPHTQTHEKDPSAALPIPWGSHTKHYLNCASQSGRVMAYITRSLGSPKRNAPILRVPSSIMPAFL